MSNLPHPLGDSSAGDLFYPGSPTVTVADAPGAAGSRAVEYGEDGYSSAINRGLYALGKNEEYIQERMEAPVAKLTTTAFTPAGGNGDSYTFTGVNLFVGDTSYLPESQAMRNSLITVLDSNFNELIDSSDNRVVVKEIRNAADSASIVGDQSANGGDDDGFYNSGAIVRFKTIDPTSGTTVNSSYTIPDGTAVYLAHCTGGTMDTLATSGSEHLMRDGWGKLRPVSLAQLPAYGFAIDGSRKMRGDIDMNGNLIDNASALQGQSGADLSIQSLQDLLLKDQYATAGIKLAQSGQTALYSPSTSLTSLAGVLNSQARLTEKLVGNRVVVRGGDVTFTDASGAVTLPGGMAVVLNGEYIAVSGSFTATADADKAGVIQSDGSFVEKDLSAVAATDLLVTVHYWSSTGPAFTTKLDARWVTGRPTDVRAITVGDTQGADFTDLQDAINFTTALYNVSTVSGAAPLPVPIQIVGEITLSESVTLPDIPMRIRGDNRDRAVIKVSSAFPTSANVIEGNYQKSLLIENITFYWNGAADQDTGTCVLNNLGANSIVRNIKFTGNGSFEFARGLSWSTAIDGVVVEHCEADALSEEAIVGTDVTNARVNNTHLNSATSSSDWAISLGAGARIRDCQIGTGAASPTYGIRVLRGSKVEGCHIKLASTAAGRGILFNFSAVSGFKADFTVRGCIIENGDTSIRVEGSVSGEKVHALLDNVEMYDAGNIGAQFDPTDCGTQSRFTMRSCIIDNCNTAVYVDSVASTYYRAVVDDCDFNQNGAVGLYSKSYGQVSVVNSRFYGFGTEVTSAAISYNPSAAPDETGQHLTIKNCHLESDSGDASNACGLRVGVSGNSFISGRVSVLNTTFVGTTAVDQSILAYNLRDSVISGCNFYGCVADCIVINNNQTYGSLSEAPLRITDNRFHAFNYTPDTADTVIKLTQVARFRVERNTFTDCPNCVYAVSDGTTGAIYDGTVDRNEFYSCGRRSSAMGLNSRIIYVDYAGYTGLTNRFRANDNTFTYCGATGSSTVYTSAIRIEALNSKIQNNQIYYHRIPDSAGADHFVIYADGTSVITGNIVGLLFASNESFRDISLIRATGDGSIVSQNKCTVTGALTAGGGSTVRGVHAAGDRASVCGNGIYTIDLTSYVTTPRAVLCDGDYITCIGNVALNHDIDCSAGSGGMVIGNDSQNGATQTTYHYTSGNA